MSDPYAETDIWPEPATTQETAVIRGPNSAWTDGANIQADSPDRDHQALVERIAEALAAQGESESLTWGALDLTPECYRVLARAVLPVLDTETASLRAEVERLRRHLPSDAFLDLIEKSSLGSDDVRAASQNVSRDAAAALVRWANEMEAREAAEAEVADLRDRVTALADRGTGTDVTPTVMGDMGVLWWYDYLRSLDERWRSSIRAALASVGSAPEASTEVDETEGGA